MTGTGRGPQEKRFGTVRKTLLFLAVVLTSASSLAISASAAEGHRIVFLNLTMIDGVVRLDNINIVPGKLKIPRQLAKVPGHILFTVLDNEQSRLYEGVVKDPSNVRYEYAGEDGQLKSKWVVSDSVSFSVRMPYQEGIRSTRFSIIPEPITAPDAQVSAERNLGSVDVDLKGGSDEE